MLRQMEEEMRRVRVQDVVTQSTVSILNLAARRIAKEDERDLEQGRVGIEAVRALVDLLDAEPQREVRNALSPAPGHVRAAGRRAGARPGEPAQARRRRAPSPPRSQPQGSRPLDARLRLSLGREPNHLSAAWSAGSDACRRPIRLDCATLSAAPLAEFRGGFAVNTPTEGIRTLTDFLTDYGIVIALVCAGAGVLYGVLVTQGLLAKSPGNDRMQEISGAVQEGARAYLNRQYTIIAAVAVPLAIAIALIQNVDTGDRLRDRRHPLGLGRLHRHERLGARQRPRRRGRPRRRQPRRSTSPSRAAR